MEYSNGHYISILRDYKDNNWIKCDDKFINSIDLIELKKESFGI